MGECHCSKIAIMQLFHELKQLFPALPDHVVSQCIAQNSHDRDICARSLRATQESRPLPGVYPLRAGMSQDAKAPARRPLSLAVVDDEQRRLRPFLEGNLESNFELNVNVACGRATAREVAVPSPSYDVAVQQQSPTVTESTIRGFTSVNLTLRPPSSEPQPPIDISSQGSSFTYSSSSLDPQGFQSRLQINIGHGSASGVTAAKIKSSLAPQRTNSLDMLEHNQATTNSSPGLLATLPSQSLGPTTTMSAPTSLSIPTLSISSPSSLPSSPILAPLTSLGTVPRLPTIDDNYQPELPEEFRAILEEGKLPKSLFGTPFVKFPDEFKSLVTEQLIRKDRLAKALEVEKIKLEFLRKEVERYTQYVKNNISPEEIERQLRSEIYQLQLECDRLAEEVDRKSDRQVPLGETNEEFYQGIYTGQQYVPQSLSEVTSSQLPTHDFASRRNDNQEESDGPSWVCQRCTFNNHPLMNKCEQCDMPKLVDDAQGKTQDIHIRVTHHKFSPRQRLHNWVL